MIVLEGPDGAGKTTLLNLLRDEFGLRVALRASTSTGGALFAGDTGAKKWMREAEKYDACTLADRHPAVSGTVYDRVLDDACGPRSALRWFTKQLGRGEHLLLLCTAPPWVLRKRSAAFDQMDGVVENLETLRSAYDVWFDMLTATCAIPEWARPVRLDTVQPQVFAAARERVTTFLEHYGELD